MSILSAPADIGSNITDPIAARIRNPFSKKVENKDRPQDFPGGFTITEYRNGFPLDGSLGGPDTRIILAGNMLPLIPFNWGGEQRIAKEYYPGNPEPSAQILGAKESDLVIHGRFKDKRLRDPDLYGTSYQFALACDEMRKRGNLVRFGMHGQAGDWFRYGFLEKADFKMNKQSWVEYELTFFVVSEKQPKNNYFIEQDKNSPNAVNQDLINKVAAFQQKYSAIPKEMPQSLGDVINGLVNDVAKNVNLVTGFVDTILSAAEDVAKNANRALGLIKHAKTSIYEFKTRINALPHSFSAYTANTSSTPSNSAASTYVNLANILGSVLAVSALNASLAAMERNFKAIAQTIPIARHKVQHGETLQRISIKHYGTADNWKNIYDHNNLSTTVLLDGQILEIPRV